MTRLVSLTIRVQIGNLDGPVVVVRGRKAWALLILIEVGALGCLPTNYPGPRWSGYVHDLRKLGISIATVLEPHGGAFPGRHARYVLRSRVAILQMLGVAA